MKKERNVGFDVINILACLMVITLHHNGLVGNFRPGTEWKVSLGVECVFYCAVPIFMMLSGANLLAYRDRYDTKTFLKKRLTRVVVPWLFWAAVFLAWRLATGQMTLEQPYWRSAVNVILANKSMSIYWFFPPLIACYLAMPVLSAIKDRRKLLWYIVVICFLYHSCKPAIQMVTGLNWNIDSPIGSSLLLFVILGYLLTTKPLGQKERYLVYILGECGLLLRYFYTLNKSYQIGATDTSIKGYQWFHSVLWACAVFVALNQVPWNRIVPQWLKEKLPKISACSLGIYLIHRFVMHYEMQILGIGNNDWTWRFLFIPVTYAASLGIIWLIRKIPGGKFITGG